ncbi:MAG: hypothetical protein ACI9G9_001218 [Psychromonas sp.]|jgi:hypothetical protein
MKLLIVLLPLLLVSHGFSQVNNNVPVKNNEESNGYEKKAKGEFSSEKSNVQDENIETYQVESTEYLSNRFNSIYNQATENRRRKTFSVQETSQMNDVLNKMLATYNDDFLTYLSYYQAGQNDLIRIDALKKAKKIDPMNSSVLKEEMVYYSIVSKEIELRKVLIDLKAIGIYNDQLVEVAKDILYSQPDGSTLVLHGKEDAFAILYCQKILRIKEDEIFVISLDWLTSPQYRSIIETNNYQLPISKNIDIAFLKEFCLLNSSNSVSLALTLPKEYLIPNIDNLYLRGLSLSYSITPLDLSVQNEMIYNTQVKNSLSQNYSHPITQNYLPVLYQLRRQFADKNELEEVEYIDEKILQLKSAFNGY